MKNQSPNTCVRFLPSPLSSLSALILLLAAAQTMSAAEVKVFLLGGQSNALGRAPASGLPIALQNPQADVLYFSGKDGTVGTTLTTLRPDGKNNGEFGPEVTFGRAIADASPTTQFAIIKYAAGGTHLYGHWAPDTGSGPGLHYDNFQQTVTAGLAALQAAGHTTEIVGMVWHQGESDALSSTQYANYEANLTAFIGDVRSRYGATLPFLIGEIRLEHALNGIEFQVVADAQITVAGADPNTVFVPASDLTFSDRFHFNAPGQITLGTRFETGYAALMGGSPPAPTVSSFSNDQGGGPVAAGTLVTYTVTFSEDMHAPTVRAENFGNAGSSVLVFGTITEVNPGVFQVPVTPTTNGTLQLQINAQAAVSSATGSVLDTSPAILDPVVVTVANIFSTWISDFGLDLADQDFDDDPDGDHLTNGLEAWFGTHPGEFNPGIENLTTNGATVTFTHPQNETSPSDLTCYYQWSPNPVDWYVGNGVDGPGGGVTVTISPNTVGPTTTVTTTVSGATGSVFLRVGVMLN
jgi:hypothetical protein